MTEQGYNVDIWNEGLGETHMYKIYSEHLGQAIRMSDRKRSSQRESYQTVIRPSRIEAQGMIS